MAKAQTPAAPVAFDKAVLVDALKAFIDQPVPEETTIEQKVALLHANDLYALLKPAAQEVTQDA